MATNNPNRIQDEFADVSGESSGPSLIDECRNFAHQTIEDRPLTATLVVFGIGLGLGAVAGGLLSNARSSSCEHRRMAESLGRRVLASVRDAIPEPIRDHVSRS